MTPKEKAEELIDKFIEHTQEWDELDGYVNDIYKAKQCALIAIDEIISSNPHSNPFNTNVESTMEYWQQVKQEIQAL
jgi:hypothetical protein